MIKRTRLLFLYQASLCFLFFVSSSQRVLSEIEPYQFKPIDQEPIPESLHRLNHELKILEVMILRKVNSNNSLSNKKTNSYY